MKTREKSLFAIGLAAALGIGFLIGISVNFPKPDQSQLGGTFGKAEKFRKVQMTQKDIQLRSTLMKDTAELKKMIQGLTYFSMCTGEVSTNIELCLMAFKSQGMSAQAGEADRLAALQEYSSFIRNNNTALKSTINMLSGFYSNDPESQSQDVEKNLRDFGSYVNQLNEKNMVLSDAFASLDNFMLTNKVLQTHKEEIIQLKSIRDKLLIKGIQLGALIGNGKQVQALILEAMTAQAQMTAMTGGNTLNLTAPGGTKDDALGLTPPGSTKDDTEGKLQAGVFDGLKMETNFQAAAPIGANILIYDKPNLEFVYIASQENLKQQILANPNMQGVAYARGGALNIQLPNYNAQDVMAAMGDSFNGINMNNNFAVGDIKANLFDGVGGALTGFIGLTREAALNANGPQN